jgi:two-component system, OmpR family, response regulator
LVPAIFLPVFITGYARSGGGKKLQERAGMDTILIVDDSSFIVEGLISFLKKQYRPIAAYGGAECLQILTRETPSVIILDIMMEPMDGWETLARIKENPATRHIPVLMFSAKKISPEEAEEHRIRIDDYITKPVSPKKIIEAIEKVLTRRDVNRRVVEIWKSAGIAQEKIDQYLSLESNLEVDLSLCQNMKIQYDIIHPEDKNQEEFQGVITAIEDRIQQERGLIDSLVSEMNDAMVHRTGSGESMAAGSLLIAEESTDPGEPTGSGSENFPPLQPEEKPGEPPVAGLPVEVPENPSQPDRDPAGATMTGSPPGYLPVPVHPAQETLRMDRGPEMPVPSPVPAAIPAGPDPVPAEIAPDTAGRDVPPVVNTGEGGSPRFEKVPGPDENTRVISPVPASLTNPSVPSPALLSPDSPVTTERKVIPANPDIPPAGSRPSPMTGAGTDVPMPWDNPRDRKPDGIIPAMAGKDASESSGPGGHPRGFIFRIILFVRSLFSKRE